MEKTQGKRVAFAIRVTSILIGIAIALIFRLDATYSILVGACFGGIGAAIASAV